MERQFRTQNAAIDYRIVRSRRRTLGLEIDINGDVIAKIPYRGVSIDEAIEFVEGKEDWIIKNRQKMEITRAISEKFDWESQKDGIYDWIEHGGREIFESKISSWASVMGVEYNKIRIKDVKTRWASCSSNKNLGFCWKLFLMPEEIVDYIIVHELAHLKQMNHSPQFWSIVEQYIPDYRIMKKAINKYI